MEIRKLSESEKQNLKDSHNKERDGRIRDRIKAVLMFDQGYNYSEIARVLLLSHEAIRKHVEQYHKYNKLVPANGGSYSKLSKTQEEELISHLEINNYIYAKDIANHIYQTYMVEYTLVGAIKLLHRLGFTYKKPKLVPGKLDFDKQEQFRLDYNLLKVNLREKEALYFMDAAHPQYQTRARCGWIRKNTVKTLPTFSGWKRKHIIGAINLEDLNVITTDNAKVNGDSIIEFLNKLEEGNKDKEKIYLICDNAGYHKSKKVKEHLKDRKIELVFLPPYSPNLNPIERLWKFMHKIVTNNKYYASFEEFSRTLDKFFTDIAKHKERLKTLINDNFERITINHFCNSSG